LRETDDAGLRGRVGHERRVPFLAGDRGDVDDPAAPLGEHDADGGARDEEDGREIDREHAVPLLVADLPGELRAAGDPGVVHRDVESAPALVDGPDGALHVGGEGHVGGEPQGPLAERLRRGLDGPAVEVHEGDAGALLHEARGDGEADAAGGAGDERGLALKRHGRASPQASAWSRSSTRSSPCSSPMLGRTRYGSVRIPRSTSQQSNGDGMAPPETWRARTRSKSSSRAFVTTAPPITSACPPRYLVVACKTRSAPSLSGDWRTGVAVVLSQR